MSSSSSVRKVQDVAPRNAFEEKDFDPITYINKKFPDENSLSGLDSEIDRLKKELSEINTDLITSIHEHSILNSELHEEIKRSNNTTMEIIKEVATIKEKAEKSENLVYEMCKDIKSLDTAKRNLTFSITALKKFIMMITAVDKLREYCEKRKYRQVANLLSAFDELSNYFKKYENVSQILELYREKDSIVRELKLQIEEDIISYGKGTSMKELGYITEKQMTDALATNSDIHPVKGISVAPHFVDYITGQLVDVFGEKTLDQGGLKITTTIDYDLQLAANAIVKKGVDAAEKKYNATNGALLSLDATSGEILAMVGSRDYFDDQRGGMFNVVTQSVRQPGSSFKPIVYAAAFEKGFPPETVFYDAQTKFNYDGQSYEPHNYDGSTHGPVTMRQALQGSLNIPAVKTIFLVGIDNALDFAARLGYTTFTDRTKFGPSVVLGGGGVKMIEHIRAYGAFANGGMMNEPVGIVKVEDKKGNDLTPKRKEARQVVAPELAATLSNVLSDNAARAYVFGANNRLTLGSRPVAAKTGTTNDYHDAWTVGYTPQIVTGVWVGNNDNSVMKRGADGSIVAAPIWQEFMVEATKKLPVAAFAPPPANTATNVMLQGLVGGGITVSIDNVSGKLATEETPPENVVKQLYIPGHDILYYVNPNDPLGPPPTDPGSEPQFNAWEAGVQAWILSKESSGFKVGTPPTEFDDVHKKELQPLLKVNYPQEGQLVSGSYLVPQIEVSAVRGVQRVEYLLDQKLVANPAAAPFTAPVTLEGSGFGSHTLEIRAFDDVGNKTVQVVTFIYGA